MTIVDHEAALEALKDVLWGSLPSFTDVLANPLATVKVAGGHLALLLIHIEETEGRLDAAAIEERMLRLLAAAPTGGKA